MYVYLAGGRGLGIRWGANMRQLALPHVTESQQAISSHSYRTYGDRNPVGDISHYWHLNSTCKGRALPSGHWSYICKNDPSISPPQVNSKGQHKTTTRTSFRCKLLLVTAEWENNHYPIFMSMIEWRKIRDKRDSSRKKQRDLQWEWERPHTSAVGKFLHSSSWHCLHALLVVIN